MIPPLSRVLPASLSLLAALLLTASASAASLLPVFGTEGAEFSTEAQKGNRLHGWLPTGWVDNSEWAAISATYSALEDRPDDTFGAVRIKVEKMEDGQLQLTSYSGAQTYRKGKSYRVSGWVRSPQSVAISLGARQMGEPYEMYHEEETTTGPVWKPFEFVFQPQKDIEAIVLLAVKDVGTVDVAGLNVIQAGPSSLLPLMTMDGMEFTTPAASGGVVHGWLPKGWVDNSEWAPITATYSMLEDHPEGTFGALRIHVEKVHDGQLQLTSYDGDRTYFGGHTYRVAGWARSPEKQPLAISVRQSEEPYQAYYTGEVKTSATWQPFEYTFRPAKDTAAILMFIVKSAGTMDLSGLTVTEPEAGK